MEVSCYPLPKIIVLLFLLILVGVHAKTFSVVKTYFC